MEWFHFSDFHVGRPKSPQADAMASLIEAVKLAVSEQGKPKIDFVFITGDIAYSGLEEEYKRFSSEFLIPLRKLSAFSDATIFAVPGNHDIDCDAAIPITWDTIGKRNQDSFFSEDNDGIKVRRSREKVFAAYCDFIQKNSIVSPNPTQEVSRLSSESSFPFDILATNTAFFSDRDIDSDGESTPSPIQSIRQQLNSRTELKPVLILAHHPLECILKSQQPALSTLFREKKAVLFHGHEHSPKVTFNREGMQTFGLGAAYLATQQDQTVIPYVNTFAHCSLDDNFQIRIRSYSWQSHQGKWLNTTSLQIPECLPDNDLGSKFAEVSFPSFLTSQNNKEQSLLIRTMQRASPKPKQLFPIEQPSEEIIHRLFSVSAKLRSIFQKGTPNISKTDFNDGKMRFEIELDNGPRNLLLFIYALNHVLSSKEVEAINTELDTEGFASATVLSFGKISDDAQAMYLRLHDRKPIEIIANEGIAAETEFLLTDQQRMTLSSLDAAKHIVSLLLGKEEVFLLIIDESAPQSKFHIVSGKGDSLFPTDLIVAKLRKLNPDFAVMKYAGETTASNEPREHKFDENNYLEQCHKEYNVMKYAALANVGIRFSELPLDELYINASASDVSDNAAMRFEQIVDDHLASYPFTDELREQIQQQLLAQVSTGDRQETSHALEFCQKYSAVLITGDPGSGKTCFVKSEILAYCKRASSSTLPVDNASIVDWHSNHVPVMVALSEVAAEKDLEEIGLLAVASRLLERRGLHLGHDDMLGLATQGRLAFFFDGLDEVVSIEKRAKIVKHINDFVIEHLPTGNRVIVTSRPAAVQVVNLLPSLHKLELQGLTEAEIRTLAERLLTIKLSATTNDVHLEEGELCASDNIVISQLIADCDKNPGLSRMAQNPLLLTLLIMIYANSGAPSAKRHIIYEEAIKTLASVRGREAGHHPISVQDLRERLGAIALSVYKKESGILPVRSEITEVVRGVMERQHGEAVSIAEADSFIQKVAESTGLIALESRYGEDDGHAIVTFMHHSFLEYFAAIGLSRELEQTNLEMLVREPRWREILTLLAGIIGENEDVSPIIKRFLDSNLSEHDVDAKLLLFAIDCALECEVPSESAQRLLAVNIKNCLQNGAGRLDSWVRAEIGKRMAQLTRMCGGSEFDVMLAKLMQEGDEAVSAAAVDVVGYVYADEQPSTVISTAFEQTCSRFDVAVLSAVCAAAGRSSNLRTDAALQVITRSLKKTRRNKQAAYEALARVPSLAYRYWDDIIGGIEDSDPLTRRLSSVAAMHAGLNVDVISLNTDKKDILIRALNNIAVVTTPDEYSNLAVKKETLNHLLASATLRDRILGIRLLPFAEGEKSYVYNKLISIIRNDTPREELVAALTTLRWSGRVIALIKLGDLRIVADWLKKGTSDVRSASIRLLGCFGKDRLAVDALLSEDFQHLDLEDYRQRITALSQAKVEVIRIKELIFKELNMFLNEKKKRKSENQQRIEVLLDASRRLGENAPPSLVNKVHSLIDDYRVSKNLKQKALLCFPAIAEPTRKNIEIIIKLFTNPRSDMEIELVKIPSILAKKCKSNIDYVITNVNALSELRNKLLDLHAKYSIKKVTEHNEYCVTELRSGIEDVTQIIVAFKDFISSNLPIEQDKKTN